MDRDMRDRVLLAAAVRVAERLGLRHLTQGGVSDESGVPLRTVYRWCGKRKRLRRLAIKHARECGSVKVIAEAEALSL